MPYPGANYAASPQADKMGRVKTFSEIVATWVGLIGLLAGGLFGVVQYLDKEKADRVKVTLDFLDRQSKDPVYTSKRRLLIAWRSHEPALMDVVRKPNVTLIDLQAVVVNVVEQEQLFEHIVATVDFYESLGVCVEKNLCDAETARALFQEDARVFFNLHRPFFDKLRTDRGDAGYGQYLQKFVAAK